MKPRLEAGSLPPLHTSWSLRCTTTPHHVFSTLRPARTTYNVPRSSFTALTDGTTARTLHTSAPTFAESFSSHNDAAVRGLFGRPRSAATSRFLRAPRMRPLCRKDVRSPAATAVRPKRTTDCRARYVEEEHVNNTAGTFPTASRSPATKFAAQLRRNHIPTSCPTLYSHLLCSAINTSWATGNRSANAAAATPESEITALVEELLRLASPSGSALRRSSAAADDSCVSCALPFAVLLCDLLRHRPAAVSETVFVRCLCQLLGSTDVEMDVIVSVMVRALLHCWLCGEVKPSAAHVESTVRSLLEASSDVLLASFIESLQVRHANTSSFISSSFPSSSSSLADQKRSDAAGAEALCCGGTRAADDVSGGRQWHPLLHESAVRVCLQRILHLLTGSEKERRRPQHGGAGGGKNSGSEDAVLSVSLSPAAATTPAAMTPELRRRLQMCCVCRLPPLQDDHTRHDCAVFMMGALKGADFTTLVAVYAYLCSAGLASVYVAMRFLSDCGMCVPHVTQRGVSLSVYLAAMEESAQSRRSATSSAVGAHPVPATRHTLQPLLHARSTLLASGRGLKQIEGGLVHVNAVLNALGYAEEVRAFYARQQPAHVVAANATAAELRETPHSVMSFVHLRNVGGAVAALAELAASRPEGWVFVPHAVMECMEAVSRLVGAAGAPAQVDALYEALISFHNGALFTSHHVELVLAGVCDRIRDLHTQTAQGIVGGRSAFSASPVSNRATPHEVLERVVPIVRATLRYVGDEINADMILEVVETALHVDGYAVPLTAGLVWAFRTWMSLSLCLQELLCRVDASTQNIPFLHYYALCYARDFCDAAVFDHLAALWHVDSNAIWHRAPHLSPSCQLWKCAACGRLNSDRYNYCICSALRYSHVVCGTCGYAQDERLHQCLSCGTTLLSTDALAGAMARKAWKCGDCGARNPAKQTLLCFRCGRASGPRFHINDTRSPSNTPAPALQSFCACCDSSTAASPSSHKAAEAAYTAAVGVCHSCGSFKMDHAAQHSGVWVCLGCQQRRSTLERICPSCPQVECLPHAVCREALTEPRVCRHCQHVEANPFSVVCTACGSSDDPFAVVKEVSTAAASATSAVPAHGRPAEGCAPSDHESSTSRLVSVHWCFHCHHAQPWQDGVSLLHVCCDSCGSPCEERGRCALPQRTCGQCGAAVPAEYGGTAVCPRCAAFVEPAEQPSLSGMPGVRWNAVTVLHSCEALDQCCEREARNAADAMNGLTTTAIAFVPSNNSNDEDAQSVFMQRRPVLEKTLARLLHEWTDEGSVLHSSAWLSMRVDVVTVLGRALHRLRPHFAASLTSRRVSALFKGILTHADRMCGVAVATPATSTNATAATVGAATAPPTRFSAEEVCHGCLGTHPAELCPFQEGEGRWACEECGVVNDTGDVCRYVCAGCLALRPVVQDMLVSTCWECQHCLRANMEFERYCVHCERERVGWTAELLPPTRDAAADDFLDKRSVARAAPVNVPATQSVLDESADEGSLSFQRCARDDEIPFTPAKCYLCGLVYIEARCPLCQNHIPDVADAKGTVCEVRARHAFIQPLGTTRLQDRIFVDETLMQAHALREGWEVRYTAELGARGRMHATFLKR